MISNALFSHYLHVVNRALAAHRDEYPFSRILGEGQRILGGRPIEVVVYDSFERLPVKYFAARLVRGAFRPARRPHPCRSDLLWRVSRQHFERVIAEPELFIAHPTTLELGWLKSMVEVPARPARGSRVA